MIPSLQLVALQCPAIKQNLKLHVKFRIYYHWNISLSWILLILLKIQTIFVSLKCITIMQVVDTYFFTWVEVAIKISYKDVCFILAQPIAVSFLTYIWKLLIFLFERISLNSKKSIDVIKTSRHDSFRGVSQVKCMSQLM